MNTLHGLLNCEIGGLDWHVITTKYRTRLHCTHMLHLLCNTFVHVIYSGVFGQCSQTIQCQSLYDDTSQYLPKTVLYFCKQTVLKVLILMLNVSLG